MKQKNSKPLPDISAKNFSLQGFYNFKRTNHPQLPESNEQFKQPKVINQSTNHTSHPVEEPQRQEQLFGDSCSNAIGFHKFHISNEGKALKGTLKVEQVDVSLSMPNSKTNVINNKKNIHIRTDEELTVNNRVKAEVNKRVENKIATAQTPKKIRMSSYEAQQIEFEEVKATNQPKRKTHSLCKNFEILPNKKVQKILNSPPPRQKWAFLLKNEDRYEIGYDHKNLIRILKAIDSTINYLKRQNPIKSAFFNNLKRQIRQGMKIQITQKQIQQLLFLNDDLFRIKWEVNGSINDYDLLITLPRYNSQDERVKETRKKIVGYLIAMEIEYLQQHPEIGKDSNNLEKWAHGFDPNSYEIPTKLLPSHPTVKNAQIRNMTREQISKVPSSTMRQIFMKKKDQADSKSMVSDDIVKMVFNKQPNMSIKEKLFQAIKQKEQLIESKQQSQFPLIDNESLLAVIDEVMITYTGKGVSNIPKATLIDIIDRKLPLKVNQITQCIKAILQAQDIRYLKEVVTSSKMLILQLDRTKYNSMRQYAKNLRLYQE